MQIPKNAPAREIVRLGSVNQDIDLQLIELVTRKAENAVLIDSLQQVAQWSDGEDQPVEPANPEIEPESEAPDA